MHGKYVCGLTAYTFGIDSISDAVDRENTQ